MRRGFELAVGRRCAEGRQRWPKTNISCSKERPKDGSFSRHTTANLARACPTTTARFAAADVDAMADEGKAATSSGSDGRPAERARLRKERREAKIKAGGSARLKMITGMGGRLDAGGLLCPGQRALCFAAMADRGPVCGADVPKTAPEAATAPTAALASDPDEVDISLQADDLAAPTGTTGGPRVQGPPTGLDPAAAEAELRRMMLQLDSSGPGLGAASDLGDDPLGKMLAQMMAGSGAGSPPGSAPAFPGMPGVAPTPPPATPDASATLLRCLHALLALGLGLYIALLTPFAGTKVDRERASLAAQTHRLVEGGDDRKRLFFWIFATGEALLLATGFFLDRARPPPAGLLWTLVGHLPEPARGYTTVALRYGQIFKTLRTDILTCIFVLGACTWWRS